MSKEDWRAVQPFRVDAEMRFSDDGLVLGFGTILAAGASPRDIHIRAGDARLLALLSAAHLREPAPEGLSHLGKAVQRRREGADALAAMHLALSGLDRLPSPRADALRLFLA